MSIFFQRLLVCQTVHLPTVISVVLEPSVLKAQANSDCPVFLPALQGQQCPGVATPRHPSGRPFGAGECPVDVAESIRFINIEIDRWFMD